MKVIQPGYELITEINGPVFLQQIEAIGRVCYKSEDRITDTSYSKFVKMLVERGHEAMIEHAPSISVKFTVDRGVSHEIVRHRLFSFAQESTRYCNYGKKGVVFIVPSWFSGSAKIILKNGDIPMTYSKYLCTLESDHENWDKLCNLPNFLNTGELYWYEAMLKAEAAYNDLVAVEWSPQEARSVLPNSLKTEIVVTGNVREWRHFFKMRVPKTAHPQMREVSIPLLHELVESLPIIFDDLLPLIEEGRS